MTKKHHKQLASMLVARSLKELCLDGIAWASLREVGGVSAADADSVYALIVSAQMDAEDRAGPLKDASNRDLPALLVRRTS